MQIIENILPQFYVEELRNIMTDTKFPWFYMRETVYASKDDGYTFTDEKTTECAMFSHSFFMGHTGPTDTFGLVKPALYFIKQQTGIDCTNPRNINRIKSNLMLQQHFPHKHYNTPHLDFFDKKHTTVLIYLNDSDGDTVFFDADKKECLRNAPVAGTGVVFDSHQFHASTPPRMSENRLVLNCVIKNA